MVGSLIGIFITASAIVIGADSALLTPDGKREVTTNKICRTGPQSVASIQGVYEINDPTGKRLSFLGSFQDLCVGFRDMFPPMDLSEQSTALSKILKSQFRSFLKRIPSGHFYRPFGIDDPHVLYVTVAGYQESRPSVFTRQVEATFKDDKWVAGTSQVSSLTFENCGMRFIGKNQVITKLIENDVALPERERNRPEVIVGRKVKAGGCSELTPEVAKALFMTAVRNTIQFGHCYGIRKGKVGGNLILFVIPKSGDVRKEVISESNYLKQSLGKGKAEHC